MDPTRSTRRRTRLALTGMVVALLGAPVALDRDDFPLSTFPMYSRTRGSESTFVTAHGITADGERRHLTPTLIGESDDPLIVVGELRAVLAAEGGDRRCGEIASRVARRADLASVVAIEVVSERHDTVARTRDESSLLNREIEARCEVGR